MDITSLTKFWTLINSNIQEFWAIIEPQIEETAVRNNIPIELYLYSELGLNNFSIEEFQQRDPFSNPEQFNRVFPSLEIKGWIAPMRDEGRYEVTERARDGVRLIIQAGDARLLPLDSVSDVELKRLLHLLKQVVEANSTAPEPPQKWSIAKRFRAANEYSPTIVQIREYLMDLFAYRDDAYLAAARPHFNQAGIVWSILSSVWSRQAVTLEQITEVLSFRGYEMDEYAVALQAAVEVGWLEETNLDGEFHPTSKGKELCEQVELLTDQYFYRPWTIFSQNELDELYNLLAKLREQLHGFKKLI